MSSMVTVVGGVHNGRLHGLVSIPIAADFNGSSKSALQGLLTQISNEASAAGSVLQLPVADTIGRLAVPSPSASGYHLLELTVPIAGDGQTPPASGAPATISASVPGGYRTVVVDAPGSFTIRGGAMTNGTYVLGAESKVDLITGSGLASVIAGGGADTIDLVDAGSASILGGSAAVTAGGAADTIDAYGSAQTKVTGGLAASDQLKFLNAGTAGATVSGGVGRVTAFGGAGGGTFYAGAAGNSSLQGGAGAVNLYGGASGDVLEAGVSTGGASVEGINQLVAGSGNETLFATSHTGVNLLIGGSGADSLRSDGHDVQVFVPGSGQETLTGSSMKSAFNKYVFGFAPTSSALDVITNFRVGHDIFGVGGNASIAGVADVQGGSGALVRLSDGTNVLLRGVNAGQINVQDGGQLFM